MLVSLNDMKNYLGLQYTTEFDAFLTTQLTIVSDAIEMYCSRKFQQANYTQIFYREEFPNDIDFKEIQLAVFPLVSVSVIKEYFDEANFNLEIGKEITDYRVSKEVAVVRRNQGSRFFYDGDILKITFTAGYSTVPALVTSVVYSIVEERYNKKINGIDLNFGSDVQRISISGVMSIDFDYSLENNQRKTHLGSILGNHVNILDGFRSERSVIGSLKLNYVS